MSIAHCPLLVGSSSTTNNGLIDTDAESQCVPEMLFKAGLAKQPAFSSYYGPVTVVATNLSNVGTSNFAPSITHVVEFANLPCEVVQEIDRKIDNDDLATGKAIAKGITSGSTCAAGSIVPYYAVAL